MDAFLPADSAVVLPLGALVLAELVVAYVLSRVTPAKIVRYCAWLLVITAFAAVERLTADQPAGFRMLAIIAAVLFGMKGVVCVEARLAGEKRLNLISWVGFTVGWFGMRPSVFAAVPGMPREGAGPLLRKGLQALSAGILCIAVAAGLNQQSYARFPKGIQQLLVAGILLTGLSFVVHFGIFNLLAGLWRLAGAKCRALFRSPIASRRLGEFWGRRWNLAFSEMTAIAVYRPLCRRLGRGPAGVLAFLFSGLLHELAISVPVQAGYGLPFAYFCLQVAALQIERRLEGPAGVFSRFCWVGKVWTAVWLLVPLPLLFHAAFFNQVFLPLIH